MNQRSQRTEVNTNTVTGSTLHGSPVVAGSHAEVTVHHDLGTADEQHALAAVDELRVELDQALAGLARRDDEARETLQLARHRLEELEAELAAGPAGRDPQRMKKLLTGIRDAVTGLTGLVTSVDGLWESVEGVLR